MGEVGTTNVFILDDVIIIPSVVAIGDMVVLDMGIGSVSSAFPYSTSRSTPFGATSTSVVLSEHRYRARCKCCVNTLKRSSFRGGFGVVEGDVGLGGVFRPFSVGRVVRIWRQQPLRADCVSCAFAVQRGSHCNEMSFPMMRGNTQTRVWQLFSFVLTIGHVILLRSSHCPCGSVW